MNLLNALNGLKVAQSLIKIHINTYNSKIILCIFGKEPQPRGTQIIIDIIKYHLTNNFYNRYKMHHIQILSFLTIFSRCCKSIRLKLLQDHSCVIPLKCRCVDHKSQHSQLLPMVPTPASLSSRTSLNT